jgi:hypothetical protein
MLRVAEVIASENSLVVVSPRGVLSPRSAGRFTIPRCPKAVAARDKVADFVRVLLKERMIDIRTLQSHAESLDAGSQPAAVVLPWAQRRADEAMA